ncbi:MAG: response regulator [Kofleriaceae bacterium]
MEGDSRELKRPAILVVDDSLSMREYLERLLGTRWGVEAVCDGEAGLAALRARSFDLVITDLIMPRLDGFAMLHQMKQDPAIQHVPVLVLSGRSEDEARIEGVESWVSDYLMKPFSNRELIARVTAQLELRAARRDHAILLERAHAARCEADLQRQRLASLLVQAPIPIAILQGPSHVITLANPAMCEIWGSPANELVGRPALEACPQQLVQDFEPLANLVLATGERQVGKEARIQINRWGTGIVIDAYFTFVYEPLRGLDGEVEGVICNGVNVTEAVLAREQLAVLRAQTEATNRAKDEFLAMLGHELRNPLSPITTTLQVMRLQGMDSAELNLLERQVSHMARLVDDLLDVSRIARGKVELRHRDIEVSEVVDRALELTSDLIESRGHRVYANVRRRGLELNVDPDRMVQVLSNLLTNAAKYSDYGSRIDVEAVRAADAIQIVVRDEGVGIDTAMIDRVFDVFVQQPQTLERSRGGLGLGLAIVRSITEAHGGAVSVASEVGKGSAFTISLPVIGPQPRTMPRASEPPPEAHMPGQRILIVDDNEDALLAMRQALLVLGYQVAVARDAPAALAMAAAFDPEIALLDIGLPVMDGYELARRLRQQPRDHALHLVAVTGYGQDSDRRRSAAAGFHQHVVKPVDLHRLQVLMAELTVTA